MQRFTEILTKGYENALLLVTQGIDTIMTGEGIDNKDPYADDSDFIGFDGTYMKGHLVNCVIS